MLAALLLVGPLARGDLLITSGNTDSVLRYDSTTGAFIDVLVPSGSGGLVRPIGMAVGPDQLLYASGSFSNNILRSLNPAIRRDVLRDSLSAHLSA